MFNDDMESDFLCLKLSIWETENFYEIYFFLPYQRGHIKGLRRYNNRKNRDEMFSVAYVSQIISEHLAINFHIFHLFENGLAYRLHLMAS